MTDRHPLPAPPMRAPVRTLVRCLAACLAGLVAMAGCEPRSGSAREAAVAALDAAHRQSMTARVSVRFDHRAGAGTPVETARLAPGWRAGTITSALPSRAWRTMTITADGPTRLSSARGATIAVGDQLRWGMDDSLALTPWLMSLATTPQWGLAAVRDAGQLTAGGARARRLVGELDRSQLRATARALVAELDPPEQAQLRAERRAGQRWLPGGELEVLVRDGRAVALILRDEDRPAGPLSVRIELAPTPR